MGSFGKQLLFHEICHGGYFNNRLLKYILLSSPLYQPLLSITFEVTAFYVTISSHLCMFGLSPWSVDRLAPLASSRSWPYKGGDGRGWFEGGNSGDDRIRLMKAAMIGYEVAVSCGPFKLYHLTAELNSDST